MNTKYFLCLFVLFLVFFTIAEVNTYNYSPVDNQNCCTLDVVKKIGSLYIYSLPISDADDLEEFIQENKALLTSNSCMIKCMEKAGSRMTASGLNAYDPKDYNKICEKVQGMGGPEKTAHDIANSIESPAISSLFMGQDLSWLASVLPKMANGDWEDFYTTEPYFRTLMRQEHEMWKYYADLYDYEISSFMQQYFKANHEQIANQVAYSIIMFAN